MNIFNRSKGQPSEDPPGLAPGAGEKMVIFSELGMR